MQVSVPKVVPLVRLNVTVTPAPEIAALVVLFLMVTVSAGRQPLPLVSDVFEVALTYDCWAAVVLVVVVGAAVVVVGAAVVVVVGAAVVVVGAAVVVVVGAAVVLDELPGMEVPVGAPPLVVGNAPMRLLVVS